ncbi:glycosyltransferase [Maritimibacter sp. UBA3975]|uniref:glycosyltransferase n=1 Tax=Maritimibacter sp. UBA3975 TaxID=1946833 RepID=UPI000C0A58C7|nr:glycosyltransferase [Maritimibacter sp. UBA3975]MAM60220.1 hypothetical protein [Maritimibacter sp.]|tara:strand:+ start:789 stop:2288 length:1500 start_codon:yes stop_codon:yes gene_type:complete
MTKTRGFLYYADTPHFIAQAERSVASLRAITPEAHVTLATTLADPPAEGFDAIQRIEIAPDDHTRIGKIRAVTTAPYDKVIYVDSDTIFAGDVTSVFDALEDFGLAACHTPFRRYPLETWDLALPECFTGLNAGFIGLNLTDPATRSFLSAWEDSYRETIAVSTQDQPSFNRLLYRSDVRFLILPPEYNFRAEFSHQSKGAGMGVKVIHSHNVNEASADQQAHLVRLLSDERFATYMRRGDEYHVQFTKLPSVTAAGFVASSFPDAALRPALRAAHVWQAKAETRDLRQEALEHVAGNAKPLRVLQIGAPIDVIDGLLLRNGVEGAICVTDWPAVKRMREMLAGRAGIRLVEAGFAQTAGGVAVHRPRSEVPPEDRLDRPTARDLLQYLLPSRAAAMVRTTRPALPWAELVEASGIPSPVVVALATQGEDSEIVSACLAAIDAGTFSAPALFQIQGWRSRPARLGAMRRELRAAGYWVVSDGPKGTTAIRPDAVSRPGP